MSIPSVGSSSAGLTQANIEARLIALLPSGWFADGSAASVPILNAVVSGAATVLYSSYALIQYARTQTRISTASGAFLDLIAYDYFARVIRRRVGELDAALQARVKKELIRERVTRKGMIQALLDLTGFAPSVFEPCNPLSTGGYGVGSSMGYGVAGGWGNLALPSQAFLIVSRPGLAGIPNVAGYGNPQGGYGVGQAEYVNASMVTGNVTDADIYATIEATKPTGTLCWTQLIN